MTTVLQYLVIAAVIGLALFGISLLLFGRGERMAALPARTSPAQLPDAGITGTDVRKVRFALALRGYRMSDVDWTLERLADELDRTRERLAAVTAGDQLTSDTTPADPEPAPTEPGDQRAAATAVDPPDPDAAHAIETAAAAWFAKNRGPAAGTAPVQEGAVPDRGDGVGESSPVDFDSAPDRPGTPGVTAPPQVPRTEN